MKFEILFDLKDVNCQWKGGKYKFTVEVPESYPMAPPKCHCDT
jgi:ubiquitin-protein ligase